MMLPFQWNSLRTGDRVAVHDDLDPAFGLGDGVVTMIQTRRSSANEVGIRLDDPESGVVWPRRHAVHALPLDPTVACWRCDVNAASPTAAEAAVSGSPS